MVYRKFLIAAALLLVCLVVGGTFFYLHVHPSGKKTKQHFDKLEWGLVRALERRMSGDVGRHYKDAPTGNKKRRAVPKEEADKKLSAQEAKETPVVKPGFNTHKKEGLSPQKGWHPRSFLGLSKMQARLPAVHGTQTKQPSSPAPQVLQKRLSPSQWRAVTQHEQTLPHGVQHIEGLMIMKGARMVVAQASGQIIDVLVRQGEAVKQGQALVVFDNKVYYSNLKQAMRDLKQVSSALAELRDQGDAQSKLKRQALQKQRAVAQAQITANQSYLNALAHPSPMLGRVASVGVRVGDWVKPGAVLVKIVPNHAMQWVALLPLDWAQAFQVGQQLILQAAANDNPKKKLRVHVRVVAKQALEKAGQPWALLKADVLPGDVQIQEATYWEVVLPDSGLRRPLKPS